MWNPFSRRQEPVAAVAVAEGPLPAVAVLQRHDLAQVETMGDVLVVTFIADELTFRHGAQALADLLDDLVEAGHARLVFDIQNVRFMDSACIGCLVDAINRLARAGGRIAVANPGSGVSHIFRITRLDRVFPICSDVMAAVKAVERGRDAA